jgi:hypothetical protein
VRELDCKYNPDSEHNPIEEGIVPTKSLPFKYSMEREEAENGGIVPTRELESSFSSLTRLNLVIEFGIVPEREFELRYSFVRLVAFPMAGGSVPTIAFVFRSIA